MLVVGGRWRAWALLANKIGTFIQILWGQNTFIQSVLWGVQTIKIKQNWLSPPSSSRSLNHPVFSLLQAVKCQQNFCAYWFPVIWPVMVFGICLPALSGDSEAGVRAVFWHWFQTQIFQRLQQKCILEHISKKKSLKTQNKTSKNKMKHRYCKI